MAYGVLGCHARHGFIFGTVRGSLAARRAPGLPAGYRVRSRRITAVRRITAICRIAAICRALPADRKSRASFMQGRLRGRLRVLYGTKTGRCLPLDSRRFGELASTKIRQPRGDEGEIPPPGRLGDRWQNRVPQGQEGSPELELTVRPGEEPQVQVCGAIAPAVHMHSGHAVEGPDSALQPDRQHAEFGREQVRQVTQIQVRAGLKDQHHRKPGRSIHRTYPPPLAGPDVRLIGSAAGGAFPIAFAATGRLGGDRIIKLFDVEIALKGEGGPLGEVRHGGRGVGHEGDPNCFWDRCPHLLRPAIRRVGPPATHLLPQSYPQEAGSYPQPSSTGQHGG